MNTDLMVTANVDPRNLADSIRAGFADGAPSVELHAVGASAINQAVKAVAIVRRHHRLPVQMVPTFVDLDDPEKGTITGMKLHVTVEREVPPPAFQED